MTRKTPIRIFMDAEDLAKLNHLAGDAMETPNKLGAYYLTAVVQDQHAKRQDRLAEGQQPEPKNLDWKTPETGGGAATAAPSTTTQAPTGV